MRLATSYMPSASILRAWNENAGILASGGDRWDCTPINPLAIWGYMLDGMDGACEHPDDAYTIAGDFIEACGWDRAGQHTFDLATEWLAQQ